MTQLHHDRLLDEGQASAAGADTFIDTAGAPSPRREPDRTGETFQQTVPTQRPGDAQPSDTSRTDAPAGKPEPADLTGLAESTARAGIGDLPEVRPGDTRSAGERPGGAQALRLITGGRRRRRGSSGPPAPQRRPALYLAAALVGATGLALFSAGDRVAQADPATPDSVSVAEELGLDLQSQVAVPEADAAARLGEVTASRAAREAEQAAAAQAQAAAAQAQAEADRLAAEAARPDAVLPVAGARLTSGFGSRWGTLHAGIDLAAPIGTPEYAAVDGVVLEAGPASGYGLAVYIQHENGDVTVYGHMEQILVTPGQVVRAGDTIALLGNRGQSTGPHLHFEVHVGGINGQKIDPLPWLREHGVQI